jgi:hypothetical protein
MRCCAENRFYTTDFTNRTEHAEPVEVSKNVRQESQCLYASALGSSVHQIGLIFVFISIVAALN